MARHHLVSWMRTKMRIGTYPGDLRKDDKDGSLLLHAANRVSSSRCKNRCLSKKELIRSIIDLSQTSMKTNTSSNVSSHSKILGSHKNSKIYETTGYQKKNQTLPHFHITTTSKRTKYRRWPSLHQKRLMSMNSSVRPKRPKKSLPS